MRLALVSDIHANLEAATAVFEDMDRHGVDQVVSLGDNVGYGPDPAGVLRLLEARNVPSLLGNHEWAMADPSRADGFSRPARDALLWTIAALPPELVTDLARLPVSMSLCGCRLVHGLPPGDIFAYLHGAGPRTLRRAFARTAERLAFVDHSHMLEGVELTGRSFRRFILEPGHHRLPAARRVIINVGSVGQPQDGDGRAKYAIYDSAGHSVAIRAVPYDIEATARKIVERGLPTSIAKRLRQSLRGDLPTGRRVDSD